MCDSGISTLVAISKQWIHHQVPNDLRVRVSSTQPRIDLVK